MENLIFTQLSITEVRQLLRQELEGFFSNNKLSSANETELDQLLTIQQAGELLKLTVPTLYGYVHRCDIPVCKRGKRLYFSKKDLESWVKEGRKKTTSEISAEADLYLSKNKRR